MITGHRRQRWQKFSVFFWKPQKLPRSLGIKKLQPTAPVSGVNHWLHRVIPSGDYWLEKKKKKRL